MTNKTIFESKGLFIAAEKEELLSCAEELKSTESALDSKNELIILGQKNNSYSRSNIKIGIKLNPDSFIKNSLYLSWKDLAMRLSKSSSPSFPDYLSLFLNNYNETIITGLKVEFNAADFQSFLPDFLKISDGLDLTYCQIYKNDDKFEAWIFLMDQDLYLLKEHEKSIRKIKAFNQTEKTRLQKFVFQKEECIKIIKKLTQLELPLMK